MLPFATIKSWRLALGLPFVCKYWSVVLYQEECACHTLLYALLQTITDPGPSTQDFPLCFGIYHRKSLVTFLPSSLRSWWQRSDTIFLSLADASKI